MFGWLGGYLLTEAVVLLVEGVWRLEIGLSHDGSMGGRLGRFALGLCISPVGTCRPGGHGLCSSM